MGVAPATFSSAGQISQHYIPGAYSRRNFINNQGGGVSSGNVCIFGYSELGEPQKLLVFDSANNARSALSSGAGLDGVIQAFNPGGGYVPQQIGFMRVNPGTQSSRTLLLSAADVFGITSFDYGVPMNQLRLKYSAGSTMGTYKIETEYKGAEEETDNITRESFSIQYTGAGTPATMTINATTLATTCTGAGTDDLSITLLDYPTISELVQFIDNQTNWSATVITSTVTQLSSLIDAVTAVDVLSTAYTVKSDYQALYEALASNYYIDSVTKEGTIRAVPTVDSDYVYFAGGTSGAYTTSEFTDSLEVAEEEDIQLISTVSVDAAVHTLIKNHCVTMSGVEGRKERQFYVGGTTGEDVDATVARALVLNSEYGSLCYPGFYNYDDAGVETLYSPAYYACQQVGMVSSIGLNVPTTQKTANIIKWETNLTRANKNALIKGGVLCGARDDIGQYITVRSITTYQSALLQKNEASIMREALYQSRDLRERMAALIGTPNVGNDQLATVDSIFERAIHDWYGIGIILASGGVLYNGYTRRISGDQIVLEYNTWDTAPTNFVFITHNISVLST